MFERDSIEDIKYLIEKFRDSEFLKKLRGLFSTEFLFRCFVGLQGVFVVIWISLAHDDWGRENWYFVFPVMEYDRYDRAEWWISLAFYLLVPFIIIKTIDWISQGRDK